ncbi:MAG: ATP-binding protein [Betaproteobacteria bacterium]
MESPQQAGAQLSAFELESLYERLRNAEDTLDALRRGAADAIVVQSSSGPQVYALQSADAPYRVLVEHMQEAALTISQDGDVLYCNPRFRDLLQLLDEPVLGRPISEMVVPLDRPMLRELMREAAGGRARADCRLRRPDGTAITVQIALSELVTDGFHGLCAIVTDLSDYHRNQEIAHSEKLNRAILDQASDVMLLCDSNARVRRANQAGMSLLGAACIGKSFDAVCAGATQLIEAITGGREVRGMPITYQQGNSRTLDLLASAKVLDQEASNDVTWIVTLIDITLLKRAERSLQETDRKKDEFLAMLAHELRNPLAPIRSAIGVMRRIEITDPTLAWGRDVIDRQVEHLVRLVDDLLDVSRLTQGKITLKKSRVALARIVERAVETSRPLIEAHNHQLTVALPDAPIYVDCDAIRLSQVIANLLNNATKYTPASGQIRIDAERRGESVIITVKDNGIGIPADALAGVFDLFTQAERSLARAEGGLGIGLTLVRRLVEAHGGSVQANSAGLGQGSEFTVELPLATESGQPTERVAAKPGAVPLANGCRILLVDDNVDSADAMCVLLEMFGHDVRKAGDGPSALILAQQFEPQIVLCDIGLPGMDGYEVIRRLRQACSGVQPIVAAITGYGQAEDRLRSEQAGFDHHLVKPVDWKALEALISAAGETFQRA